jgi:prolyl-tRNA synthetase
VVSLRPDDASVSTVCESVYGALLKAGVDVLYDDTPERPGAKFSTLELAGIPTLVVVGPKGVKAGVVEVRDRATGAVVEMSAEAAIQKLVGTIGG